MRSGEFERLKREVTEIAEVLPLNIILDINEEYQREKYPYNALINLTQLKDKIEDMERRLLKSPILRYKKCNEQWWKDIRRLLWGIRFRK